MISKTLKRKKNKIVNQIEQLCELLSESIDNRLETIEGGVTYERQKEQNELEQKTISAAREIKRQINKMD